MKKIFTLLAFGLVLSLGTAHATDEASAQQSKMKTCNAEAKTKDLKGDERKAFMKECLSAKPAAEADTAKKVSPQQEKMKTCNADAKSKELKGDERKAFMKDCLSTKK